MGRIVMYKGQSAYNVLRYFVDELAAAFKELGKEAVVVDLLEKDPLSLLKAAFNEPCEFVFSFNAMGIDLSLDNRPLYDAINVPIFSFLVDHPVYHLSRLNNAVNNHIIACVDRHHLIFINNYYQGQKTCAFLPHAGSGPSDGLIPSFSERDVAIFFPGSFMNATEMRVKWKDWFGCFSDLMDDIVAVSLNQENTYLEESVNIVFNSRGIRLEKKVFDIFWRLMPLVNNYIRAYRRQECLKILTEAGLEVFVGGKSWPAAFGDKLKIGNELDFIETIALMRRAKIVLNVNPNLQDSHERVFYAMLNGAVCVSDRTSYLAEEFTDGEDLILFSWKDISNLVEKIYSILRSPEQWLAMASAGRKKASKRHIWPVRAQRIIELVSYFKTLKALEEKF
jgi:glycosyltransferase involved in cell wall biosynthesis